MIFSSGIRNLAVVLLEFIRWFPGKLALPLEYGLPEQIFNLPVRRGTPKGIGGLVDVVRNPMYATGVGLVQLGSRSSEESKFKRTDRNLYVRVKSRFKEMLGEIF